MATQAAIVDQKTEIRQAPHKLTLAPLIALVVGSMIGGGVFNLPSDMSRGCVRTTHGRFWTRYWPPRWMRGSGTRSWPRHGGIRWLFSSCHGD